MLFITLSRKELKLMVKMQNTFCFFKLSPCRGEDYGEIQQKLDVDEVVSVKHVE